MTVDRAQKMKVIDRRYSVLGRLSLAAGFDGILQEFGTVLCILHFLAVQEPPAHAGCGVAPIWAASLLSAKNVNPGRGCPSTQPRCGRGRRRGHIFAPKIRHK